MSGKSHTISYVLFLFILSALMMLRQLMSSGYFSVSINDTYTYTSWAWQFTEALKEGLIYPRWMPLNFWGYGSPTFILYPPLAYYLVALFSLFTDSIINAMNIVKFVSLFLTAIGLFLLVSEFYPKKIAFSVSIFYIILPSTVNTLYTGGAFASTISLVWFSPIMLFTYKYFKIGQFKNLLFAGTCYGGLILTHLINAFMFGFVITAFVISMAIANRKMKDMMAIFYIGLIGTLVSAAYLIPLFYEKQFINFENFLNMADYSNFFIMPNRIEKLPVDHFWRVYYFEFVVYILFYLILLYLIYLQVQKLNNIKKIQYSVTLEEFFIWTALFTIFLQFGISSFLWENIPYFKYVQFPARWLTITTFVITCLTAIIFYALDTLYQTRKKYFTIGLFFLLFLVTDINIISKSDIFTEQELLPAKEVNWTLEHLPAGVDLNTIKNDNSAKKAVVTTGKGKIEIIKWRSSERTIKISAKEPLTLRIKTFYFPGWKAYIDKAQTDIQREDDSGAMLINISKGEHTLELRFEDTPIRYYAKVTWIISILLLFLFVVWKFKVLK